VRAARADRRATALAAAAALTCPVRTAAGPADWRWSLNSWPGEQCLNAKLDLDSREIRVRGKGGRPRIVKISYEAARSLDRYLRVRGRHEQAHRPQLWLGVGNRGPLTATGIYQIVARRGRECGVAVHPHRIRHHFSHTWLDRGGAEGDLMELNGWSSPQMLTRYGASARAARARRTYDRIMNDSP